MIRRCCRRRWRRLGLRHRYDLYARVVVVDDLRGRPAAEGHAVGADLAEADAVSPALAVERVAVDAVGIAGLVEDEEVVGDVERPADGEAAQDERAAPF